jgi:hypothetical protein
MVPVYRGPIPPGGTTLSDEEPTLPLELPIKVHKRTWRQRIKAVFTEPVKLPGWAAVAFVALQVIPDWKSRFDFWVDVAKQTGGYLAVAATVIASPYFTPSLLTAGLAWILFAGEAPRGVQRHHWMRYVGWSVFLVCFTTIVVTAGYGAIEFYIKEQVSTRDTEIQRQSAVRPVFWHLTDAQKTALGIALDKIPEGERFSISILCLPDAGSRTFTSEFAKVLKDHEWKFQPNCLFNDLRPDFTGISVSLSPSLRDKVAGKPLTDSAYPPNLRTLTALLIDAKIEANWGVYDDPATKNQDVFWLLIGNAP